MGLPLGNDLWILLVSLVVAIGTSLVVALAPYTWASLRPKNFPPGPKPLPLIGNLNLIPPSKAFLLSVSSLLLVVWPATNDMYTVSTNGQRSTVPSSDSNSAQQMWWSLITGETFKSEYNSSLYTKEI